MKCFITAWGCVNFLGLDSNEFVRNINYIKYSDITTESCLKNFEIYDRTILKQFYKLDIYCQYLLNSVNEVMHKTNLLPNKSRIGVIVGATAGPVAAQKRFVKSCRDKKTSNGILFKLTANNIFSGLVSIVHEIQDYNITIYNGNTSSVDAVNMSLDLLNNNIIDIALVSCVELGTLPVYAGAASLIIERFDRNNMNLEISKGKQIHLFSEDAIQKYIDSYVEEGKYDSIYYNESIPHIEGTNNVNCDLNCFGAMGGLLQIIVASQHKLSKTLIINRDKEQLSEITIRRGL